jgi:eukaryotic-like serine/threonine-protein kinase
LQPDYAEAYHNLAWVLVNMRGQDGKARFREILSAYHKAAELYAQQQKHSFAQNIKQAILSIGIKL